MEFIYDGRCYRTEHAEYYNSDVKEYLYLLDYIPSNDWIEINRDIDIIEIKEFTTEDEYIEKLETKLMCVLNPFPNHELSVITKREFKNIIKNNLEEDTCTIKEKMEEYFKEGKV